LLWPFSVGKGETNGPPGPAASGGSGAALGKESLLVTAFLAALLEGEGEN